MRETRAFRFRIRPELASQYVQRHLEVWPEFREGLRRCGWENYQLFLDQETSTVFGYLESENLEHSLACARELPDYEAWQREMQMFFDRRPGEADEGFFTNIVCIFRLSDNPKETSSSTRAGDCD